MNQDLFNYGIRLLARRAHAEKELERKLARRGTRAEIAEVIERLRELRYLNDTEFAWMRAVSCRRFKGWGNLRIRLDLKRLGVDARMIDFTLERLEAEFPEADGLGKVVKAWKKTNKRPTTMPELKKLFDHCVRRGFPPALVRDQLREDFGQVSWEETPDRE